MRSVARITERFPLLYAEGSYPHLKLPTQVRAGSGCCFIDDDTLAVIQENTNAIALVDVASRRVDPVALPAGAGGARPERLEFEALAYVDEMLVALGSGAVPARERVITLDPQTRVAELRELPRLFKTLRKQPLLENAALDIEGLVALDERTVRLFQRGNARGAVNATVDVSWPFFGEFGEQARVLRARRWNLGAVNGVPLAFTDATRVGDAIVFLCVAQTPPGAAGDGAVVGCGVGVLEGTPPLESARVMPLLDEGGAPFLGNPEGIAADPVAPGLCWVVADPDDPALPCELLRVALPTDDHAP